MLLDGFDGVNDYKALISFCSVVGWCHFCDRLEALSRRLMTFEGHPLAGLSSWSCMYVVGIQ